MSLFYCIRSPLTAGRFSSQHLTDPRFLICFTVTCHSPGQEQSHFSSKTSSISSLWFSPKRLTDLSHLIPLQEHFKDCTFKNEALLSEWTPCDWLKKPLHPVEDGDTGKSGWLVHATSSFSPLAAQCSSTNIPTADGTNPSLSHSIKDVTCGHSLSAIINSG